MDREANVLFMCGGFAGWEFGFFMVCAEGMGMDAVEALRKDIDGSYKGG